MSKLKSICENCPNNCQTCIMIDGKKREIN